MNQGKTKTINHVRREENKILTLGREKKKQL